MEYEESSGLKKHHYDDSRRTSTMHGSTSDMTILGKDLGPETDEHVEAAAINGSLGAQTNRGSQVLLPNQSVAAEELKDSVAQKQVRTRSIRDSDKQNKNIIAKGMGII